MKKIAFAVACIMFVFFMGCEKAVNGEKPIDNLILGDWSISNAQNAATGEDIPLQYLYGTGIEYGGILNFHEDNTFERHIGITGDEDATKGIYSVQGDIITLKYDNGTVNTAIFLPSSHEIQYHLKDIFEYYVRQQ